MIHSDGYGQQRGMFVVHTFEMPFEYRIDSFANTPSTSLHVCTVSIKDVTSRVELRIHVYNMAATNICISDRVPKV